MKLISLKVFKKSLRPHHLSRPIAAKRSNERKIRGSFWHKINLIKNAKVVAGYKPKTFAFDKPIREEKAGGLFAKLQHFFRRLFISKK